MYTGPQIHPRQPLGPISGLFGPSTAQMGRYGRGGFTWGSHLARIASPGRMVWAGRVKTGPGRSRTGPKNTNFGFPATKSTLSEIYTVPEGSFWAISAKSRILGYFGQKWRFLDFWPNPQLARRGNLGRFPGKSTFWASREMGPKHRFLVTPPAQDWSGNGQKYPYFWVNLGHSWLPGHRSGSGPRPLISGTRSIQ